MINSSEKITNHNHERNHTYDWLRLIATIFVIIGHSTYLNIQSTYGSINYNVPEFTNNICNIPILDLFRWLSSWVVGFHMPLFFMLSGAVMALKPIGLFEKVTKSKIKRLIFPYFIYGILFMLPIKLFAGFYNKDNILLAVKGFLSGSEGSHLWFLPALFWVIIVFTILKKLGERFKVDNPYCLLIVAGVIQLVHRNIPIDILFLKQGMQYIFWFALGYCFEYERKRNKPWNLKKTIIVFILLLIIEVINKKYSILNPFFVIICGSFFSYLLADICNRLFNKITKTKLWGIIISNLFFVYLFHDPLEYLILRVFMTNGYMASAIGCILYISLRTIGVFVIGIILGELVSKLKKAVNVFLESSKQTLSKE